MLAQRHPVVPLQLEELALRLLDPLDEPLQAQHDPVDGLLVEPDVLQALDHLPLEGLDLLADLAPLGVGELLLLERLLVARHVPLELGDALDVLQDLLDLLLLLLGERRDGRLSLDALGGGLLGLLDLGLLLDLDLGLPRRGRAPRRRP